MRIIATLLILIMLNPLTLMAQDSDSPHSANEFYQAGIQSYQNNEFEKACEFFEQAWQQEHGNPLILYNWGLSEYKLENYGMAAAAWRKALSISPRFPQAQKALEFASPQLPSSPMSSSEDWEVLRSRVLNKFSLEHFLTLMTILLLFSGWASLNYLGRRRKAIQDEKPMPPFPTLAVILSALFLVSLLFSGLKTYDHFTPRATIIQQSAVIRSLPDSQANELFKLEGGAEVIIRRSANEWTQITYPGGMTGWVPREALFHTSGRQPW